jgi:hypothetical protein
MRPHRVGPCVAWPRKATAASRSTDWRALVISPSSLRRSRPRLPLHRPCDQATDQGASQARSRICPISTSRRHSANVCMDGGLTTRVDDAVKSSGSTTWRRETDSRVTRGLRQESTSAPVRWGMQDPGFELRRLRHRQSRHVPHDACHKKRLKSGAIDLGREPPRRAAGLLV